MSQVVTRSKSRQAASETRPEETRHPDLPEELSDDDMSECPQELQKALEECAKHYKEEINPEMCYEVIVDTLSHYMEDEWDIIGTYQTLKEANEELAQHFMDEGYYASGDRPEYEVKKDGRLEIRVDTDGSTGGFSTLYVREVPVKRTFGRKAR